MSNKWRSSKMVSVDGSAFKRARLVFKNQDKSPMRGEYGHGSQEWLAEMTRLSPRTVNELETGRATLKTVDAISKTLGIKGREYILGYGEDFTSLRATGVIDFRPNINGRKAGNETAYLDTAFLVTVDPLIITIDDDFIDTATLKKIEMRLTVGDIELELDWLYKVNLTSRANTWLGDEEDVQEVAIKTHQPYQSSIMFRQDFFKSITWSKFINHLKKTNDSRLLITLILKFDHFEKSDHIIVSVEEMKNLFKLAFPKNYPYWIQPKALMI